MRENIRWTIVEFREILCKQTLTIPSGVCIINNILNDSASAVLAFLPEAVREIPFLSFIFYN